MSTMPRLRVTQWEVVPLVMAAVILNELSMYPPCLHVHFTEDVVSPCKDAQQAETLLSHLNSQATLSTPLLCLKQLT